jgi:DNA mismatch repair protein PMS2
MALDLGAADEMVVMDHLETFKMNGFDFTIDEEAEPTKRIKMIAYPFTKGAEFGLKGKPFVCLFVCL